jgi:hypothetical protein
MWTLVLFFGASVMFAGIKSLTDGEPAGVTIGAQAAAGLLLVGALVLYVRSRGK